ncbi:ClpP/crotonase-like domain-containing protein [Pisolithus albus]|nr:ClpP/crotonase-like domain-containing protein [Pisolithus albus]
MTLTFSSSVHRCLRTARGVRLFTTSPLARYENVIVSKPDPAVALITLNRPNALNALNAAHFNDISRALREADQDPETGAMVITGSDKAFAAGADIKEMKDKTFAEAYMANFLANWEVIAKLRKPVIAAVSGYAHLHASPGNVAIYVTLVGKLGGGLELALQADILLAAPSAKLGQLEINLGVIPGGGGTQRLARLIGKSRTMEMVLTGRIIDAEEAERWGLVNRVVREESGVVDAAIRVAKEVASKGRVAVTAGKEAVNAAFELSLTEGLRFERRLFHSLFATKDQKEGMTAFAEKRKPEWTHS